MKRETEEVTTMQVFIVKYALTSKIVVADAQDAGDGYIRVRRPHGGTELYSARDWRRTREGAIAQSILLRDKRIASLQKSIKKLEKLTFEDAPHATE